MTVAPPAAPANPPPAFRKTKPILVTGGAGFVGCNLADRLAAEGHHIVVLDSLKRAGVEANLEWLRARHGTRITTFAADVRDSSAADIVCDVSGIFHLAAQVAVTSSLDDPEDDFDVNLGGTLNLLEAVRRGKRAVPFVFASTNKVYGDLSGLRLEATTECYRPLDERTRRHGISERQPLSFQTPYGCSKGAAEQYVLEYARAFGLRTAVLRMSCVYGPHQFGTEDQGWVAHFVISALAGHPITLFGDGRQVRDILYVDDAVEAYVRTFNSIERVTGSAFNLGGGPSNAVSLRQVLARIEEVLGCRADVHFASWRPGDQRYYVSDTRAITAALGLPQPRAFTSGITHLAGWLTQFRKRPKRPATHQPVAQVRP